MKVLSWECGEVVGPASQGPYVFTRDGDVWNVRRASEDKLCYVLPVARTAIRL